MSRSFEQVQKTPALVAGSCVVRNKVDWFSSNNMKVFVSSTEECRF